MEDIPTAIITGSSRGIGRGIAIHLATNGQYKLCLLSRDMKGLMETKKMCQDVNKNVMVKCISCDISKTEKLKSTLLDICNNYGPLHLLINNSGVAGSGNSFTGDLKHYDLMLDVNFRALVHATVICLPFLKETALKNKFNNAAIINIGSIAGTMCGIEKNGAIYSGTKFAVLGFNESIFEDAKEFGIKVSCIMPGYIDTAMVRNLYDANFDDFIKMSDITKCVQFILDCSNNACPTQIVIKNQKAAFGIAGSKL